MKIIIKIDKNLGYCGMPNANSNIKNIEVICKDDIDVGILVDFIEAGINAYEDDKVEYYNEKIEEFLKQCCKTENKPFIYNIIDKNMDFGDVIKKLKLNPTRKFMRKGWNGKGIYITLQVPDEHSKMTQPYIYIVTTKLDTDNKYAPKGVVPWLASQTDMLANDWVECVIDTDGNIKEYIGNLDYGTM